MPTGISWTDETWNVVTGCSHVSDGCRNCYAERLSLKYGWSHKPWTAQNIEENVKFHPDRLDKPRHWKTPKMVFVNSLSDLFMDIVSDTFLHKVFDVMEQCSRHTFQILTKRPVRAAFWKRWPDNVWMGTSVEDSRVAARIDALRRCEAKVKFISFEPLIGSVGRVDLSGYQWAIIGGESGPNFRSMDMAWAREIRDQCVEQGLAIHFKQDASRTPGTRPYLVEADGGHTTYQQFPGDEPIKSEIAPQPIQERLL